MYSSGRMNDAGMGRGGLAPIGHLIPTAMVYSDNLNCQRDKRQTRPILLGPPKTQNPEKHSISKP